MPKPIYGLTAHPPQRPDLARTVYLERVSARALVAARLRDRGWQVALCPGVTVHTTHWSAMAECLDAVAEASRAGCPDLSTGI